MSFAAVLLWGLAATLVLTTLLAGSQGAGLTRMNLPYMLGTIFTSNRDRAKVIGFGIHLVNGWIFSFLYALFLGAMGGPSLLRGVAIGLVHAAFVLAVLFAVLPSFHPRMATENQGPTVTRRLEPPGFLGLHYGYQTPLMVVLAHVVFGAILGYFLGLAPFR